MASENLKRHDDTSLTFKEKLLKKNFTSSSLKDGKRWLVPLLHCLGSVGIKILMIFHSDRWCKIEVRLGQLSMSEMGEG